VMHRNFRIQMCFVCMYFTIQMCCRFVLLPLSFAIERFIATHYWSWYEAASPSTLWVSTLSLSLRNIEVTNSNFANNPGATINGYSISRTFQVQENVELMRYMCNFAVPSAISGCIVIVGLALKLYGPAEWRFVRNIAYTFFDLG
ncbi:hypothetical protein PENTCL1PPCAC_14947, partial [Pristionchus entomophagus]